MQEKKVLIPLVGVFVLFMASFCFGQSHAEADRQYMAELVNGVWFIERTKEVLRIRVEPAGLSVLIDEATYLKGAEVVDLDKSGKAISFTYEEQTYTLTRSASDFLKFSGPEGVLIASRSRRLTKQDNDILDVWYKFKPNPCGLSNQHCEDR